MEERLVNSPPTKANRVQSLAKPLWIFAYGIRGGRCRRVLLGCLPFLPPHHSDPAPYSSQSPSSALKTSLLRVGWTHPPPSRLRPRSEGAMRATLTRTSSSSSLLRARPTEKDMIDCKSFYTIKDISLGKYQLGSPLIDDRPIMNAIKYTVVSAVVWTNRTMLSSNTDTNRTSVLAVIRIFAQATISQETRVSIPVLGAAQMCSTDFTRSLVCCFEKGGGGEASCAGCHVLRARGLGRSWLGGPRSRQTARSCAAVSTAPLSLLAVPRSPPEPDRRRDADSRRARTRVVMPGCLVEAPRLSPDAAPAWPPFGPSVLTSRERCRGGRAVRLLASSLQSEPGSIPGRVTPVSSQVGIVPDDAADRRLPFIPPLHSGAAPFSPRFILIGSQDLVVMSRQNHSTEKQGKFRLCMVKKWCHGAHALACQLPSAMAAPRSVASAKHQSSGFPVLSGQLCENDVFVVTTPVSGVLCSLSLHGTTFQRRVGRHLSQSSPPPPPQKGRVEKANQKRSPNLHLTGQAWWRPRSSPGGHPQSGTRSQDHQLQPEQTKETTPISCWESDLRHVNITVPKSRCSREEGWTVVSNWSMPHQDRRLFIVDESEVRWSWGRDGTQGGGEQEYPRENQLAYAVKSAGVWSCREWISARRLSSLASCRLNLRNTRDSTEGEPSRRGSHRTATQSADLPVRACDARGTTSRPPIDAVFTSQHCCIPLSCSAGGGFHHVLAEECGRGKGGRCAPEHPSPHYYLQQFTMANVRNARLFLANDYKGDNINSDQEILTPGNALGNAMCSVVPQNMIQSVREYGRDSINPRWRVEICLNLACCYGPRGHRKSPSAALCFPQQTTQFFQSNNRSSRVMGSLGQWELSGWAAGGLQLDSDDLGNLRFDPGGARKPSTRARLRAGPGGVKSRPDLFTLSLTSPVPVPCAICAITNDLTVDETLSPATYLPRTSDYTLTFRICY
ncbi:hypothetical protein PR048_010534 [Dryococelus australis]|uniref:Uncharacterized protein n=1 Tax=Dryococelus australis TaxID=614101 RepID=A0ABQ9I437_9NEOP|nr:hypothetical protein PR048_010534 [Dryococelus australis]